MSTIEPPSRRLQLGELAAGLEYAGCAAALPWLVLNAPKGRGEPVLVIPGFLTDDSATLLLRSFLRQIGYAPVGWKLGRSIGPMSRFIDPLQQQVQQLADAAAAPIRLLGWSRGGVLAREIARHQPRLVNRVVTMGSPISGGPAATSISAMVARHIGISAAAVAQQMRQRERTPISVPVTAIYSKSDGVVAWQACIDNDNPSVTHHEVQATHAGLGGNAQVYELLARVLR